MRKNNPNNMHTTQGLRATGEQPSVPTAGGDPIQSNRQNGDIKKGVRAIPEVNDIRDLGDELSSFFK